MVSNKIIMVKNKIEEKVIMVSNKIKVNIIMVNKTIKEKNNHGYFSHSDLSNDLNHYIFL